MACAAALMVRVAFGGTVTVNLTQQLNGLGYSNVSFPTSGNILSVTATRGSETRTMQIDLAAGSIISDATVSGTSTGTTSTDDDSSDDGGSVDGSDDGSSDDSDSSDGAGSASSDSGGDDGADGNDGNGGDGGDNGGGGSGGGSGDSAFNFTPGVDYLNAGYGENIKFG